jgi:hypothetical protein
MNLGSIPKAVSGHTEKGDTKTTLSINQSINLKPLVEPKNRKKFGERRHYGIVWQEKKKKKISPDLHLFQKQSISKYFNFISH